MPVSSSEVLDFYTEWIKGHKNIITPSILAHRCGRNAVVEFSSGRGMGGQGVYGVTVLTVERDQYDVVVKLKSRHDDSAMFESKKSAEEHFAEMVRKWV